jgi:dihydrofolate synthase/folylpolyglutamate synthase
MPIQLSLNGTHQHGNAAVAVEILKRWPRVALKDVLAGLTDVTWPARLEWFRSPHGCDLLIDAAHNPAGARALAAYVCSTGAPMAMVVSIMRDKDVAGIVTALAPAVSRFVVTNASSPRAIPAGELAQMIRRILPGLPCVAVEDVHEAVRTVCEPGGRAMVAGSIFLVGPLRALLLSQGAVPVRYPSEASLFHLN